MIVRWGLEALDAVLGELGCSAPYLLATSRYEDVPAHVGRWSGLPTDDFAAVAAAAGAAD